MRGSRVLLATLVGLVMTGCDRQSDVAASGPGEVTANEFNVKNPSLAGDLRVVSEARILLGHQSVGRNILAGLSSLSKEADVSLRIVEVTGAPPEGPGVFHSNIGRNGDPDSKCEMFAELLTAYGKPHYNLAMMKFCYVDLGRDTPLEAAALLERYSRLVEKIRAERPELQLVHMTMPLRADPWGKKTMVKRFLGMSTREDAANVLRNAFNDALRARYADEPLFDLAAIESTLPDGTRSAFEHEGKTVYTLASAYTEDRGHLNETAQRRAAIAFVSVLADALVAQPEPQESAAGL